MSLKASIEEEQRSQAAPVKARYYLPQLDALRFFAFAAVFLHHGLQQSRVALLRESSAFGLSLFFFLSAS